MMGNKQACALAGLALMGLVGAALADVPGSDASKKAGAETVVVLAAANANETTSDCKEATPERARSLAEKARQEGAWQRAGECYVVSGDHALANEAFVKASTQSRGDTSRRLSANLSDMKAQARQMKQAFQHR